MSQPYMVGEQTHNQPVDQTLFRPKMVLRSNLLCLMSATHGPKTQGELHRKSKVAQATIGRILGAKGNNATIETVDRLAKAYGLQGWQLLIAGMDPTNPPVLQPISKQERELYERLKQLAQGIVKAG